MTAPVQYGATDFYVREEEHHEAGGFTHLGFWIYLMSDCLIFAVLFATYGVLGASLAGGPVRGTSSTCRSSPSTPRCCSSPRSPTASRCWRCTTGTRRAR